MKNIVEMIERAINFLTVDIWRISLKKQPSKRSFLIRQLRIVLLAVRGFDEDKCQLRASALTFYSLLSFVPVVAMAFGIAKGFGFERHLERELLDRFPSQQDILGQVIGFAHSMLENTKGGMIAGIGLLILFWTVIKVLGHIERSFNDVWEIKEGRPFGRKFGDYLSMMLIAPVLMIASSGTTVFIKTQITLITEKIALLGAFSPLIFSILSLSPYIVIWSLFVFMYIFMPNTKVDFRSGLLAGIVAGTVFQIAQMLYITFQVGVAKYNAIYGSFAALPLFLIWLQASWLIVLFGAEISFAHQNVDTYEFESDCKQISNRFGLLLSLWIACTSVKALAKGGSPFTPSEISHALDIPIRLVRQILYELVESGILAEVRTPDERTFAYQPACDIHRYTVKYVTDALDARGISDLPVARSRELDLLSDSLAAFDKSMADSPENRLLLDI